MEKFDFSKDIEKLKKISKHYMNKNAEKYLKCLSVICDIHYLMNDIYADDFVEDSILKYSKNFSLKNYEADDKTVLFYDFFGLDRRGLAAIYLNALVQLKYKVIYVTYEAKKDIIPHLIEILGYGKNNELFFITNKSMNLAINQLLSIVDKFKPNNAFFYSYPSDVAGAVVFQSLSENCKRFLINLTDHAFWIGKKSCDYFIEFRDYGASISKKYRGLSYEKLIKLPYYPEIDKSVQFEGFPFNPIGRFIIFSGGALYKTIGENNRFYCLVEKILALNDKVTFWYAGTGNSEFIEKLVEKYPQRVFFTSERKDLYQVLLHCHLYLNTYPISGGLMLQYAAVAGLLPITLVHDNDALGYLLNPKKSKHEYVDEDDLILEVEKLVNDRNYYVKRKKDLQHQVISEEEFCSQLGKILVERKSDYNLSFFDENTETMRFLYSERITIEEYLRGFLVNRKNMFLLKDFLKYIIFIPKILIKRVVARWI